MSISFKPYLYVLHPYLPTMGGRSTIEVLKFSINMVVKKCYLKASFTLQHFISLVTAGPQAQAQGSLNSCQGGSVERKRVWCTCFLAKKRAVKWAVECIKSFLTN